MGLYIQGIELPKEQNVPTWAVIFSNGEVRIYKDGFNTDQGNGKGTAIPVPPHGRLGDLDALAEKAIMRSEKRGVSVNVLDKVITAYDIETAPTVIPAKYDIETAPTVIPAKKEG